MVPTLGVQGDGSPFQGARREEMRRGKGTLSLSLKEGFWHVIWGWAERDLRWEGLRVSDDVTVSSVMVSKAQPL